MSSFQSMRCCEAARGCVLPGGHGLLRFGCGSGGGVLRSGDEQRQDGADDGGDQAEEEHDAERGGLVRAGGAGEDGADQRGRGGRPEGAHERVQSVRRCGFVPRDCADDQCRHGCVAEADADPDDRVDQGDAQGSQRQEQA